MFLFCFTEAVQGPQNWLHTEAPRNDNINLQYMPHCFGENSVNATFMFFLTLMMSRHIPIALTEVHSED